MRLKTKASLIALGWYEEDYELDRDVSEDEDSDPEYETQLISADGERTIGEWWIDRLGKEVEAAHSVDDRWVVKLEGRKAYLYRDVLEPVRNLPDWF